MAQCPEYEHSHGQPYRIPHPPRSAVSPEHRHAGPGALSGASGAPGPRVRFSTPRHADAHSRLPVSGPARSGAAEFIDASRKPHPGAVAVPVCRLSACVIGLPMPDRIPAAADHHSECRPLLSPRASPGIDSQPGHGPGFTPRYLLLLTLAATAETHRSAYAREALHLRCGSSLGHFRTPPANTNTNDRSAPRVSPAPTSSNAIAPTTKMTIPTSADGSILTPRRAVWGRPAPPAPRRG